MSVTRGIADIWWLYCSGHTITEDVNCHKLWQYRRLVRAVSLCGQFDHMAVKGGTSCHTSHATWDWEAYAESCADLSHNRCASSKVLTTFPKQMEIADAIGVPQQRLAEAALILRYAPKEAT